MTSQNPPAARFYFVDVFAAQPFTGNPVAIVPDADDISEKQMQAIAREFNQSETTFILRPDKSGASCRLRSFTPIGAEVLGAGHNALGAWLWMVESGRLNGDGGSFAQQIGNNVLPVEVSRDASGVVVVAMDQSEPEFEKAVSDRYALASSLGLTEADLVDGVPAQVVSTGAGHLMVAVRDRAAVDRAVPDSPRLAAVLDGVGGEGCYVYTRDVVDTKDSVAYSRFFNPTMGIWEDPATGTAAGPLLASLVAAGTVAEGSWVIEQGHSLGRPSRIHVTVQGKRVQVSGSGLISADGTLHL